MDRNEIQRRVREEFQRELAACDRLDETTREILSTNHRGLGPNFGSLREIVVAALFAKAYKSFNAIRMLAEGGYGEDSFVIVRSLINLSIDLAYIRQDDSEERALNWFCAGGIAARTLLERLGEKPKEESQGISKRAQAWKKVTIAKKAKITGATTFYELGYHDGSRFEHSDASSIMNYLTFERGTGFQFYPWPTPRFIGHSLKSGFVVFLAVLNEWALAFDIESERFGELRDLGFELGNEGTAENAERIRSSGTGS